MEFKFSESVIAARKARDLRQGVRPGATYSHENGTCAGMYGLCGACWEDERADILAWANKQPDPEPGEDVSAYWRRIGGPFYDAWHSVAVERMRARD